MAKLLFTAIVADMRNKLNGTVFSKNRYGAYARTKVSPVNPQTPRQSAIRAIFGSLSQAWRGLTEEQRLAWINAAPNFPVTDQFGNIRYLSGNALFVRLNTVLLNAGEAQMSMPPSPEGVTAAYIMGASGNISSTTITITLSDAVGAEETVIVEATPVMSAGKNYFANLLRQVMVTPSGDTPNPTDLWDAYAAAYGAPTAGAKIGVAVYTVNINTGETSPKSTDVLVFAA